MTGPELLELTAQAIATRGFSVNGLYHLCAWDGRICCEGRMHTKKTHRIFMKLTDRDCTNGLPVKTWNWLEAELVKYYKQEVKCLPLPKP